jgi:predicted molibdopterin-dependent oxidoreductase YjgC
MITGAIASAADLEIPEDGITSIYQRMTGESGVFHGITVEQLRETHEQWPKIGRSGMYYGGTSYDNRDGLGVILPLNASQDNYPEPVKEPVVSAGEGQLLAVPITHLYDQGGTVTTSEVIKSRIARNLISLHPKDAGKIKVSSGDTVLLHLAGRDIECVLDLDPSQPEGVILVTRSMGALLSAPASAAVSALEPAAKTT